MRKLLVGLILFGALYMSAAIGYAQEAPNYSWHQELRANIGKDGRSWAKGYFGTDLVFEGSTSDGSETTFTIVNPTRDNNEVTFADGTGTVALHNFLNIYFGSSATKTLDTNESQMSVMRGYGTTNSCTIIATPSAGQVYILVNANTGNGTITLKIANGTGTNVNPGSTSVCFAGTNTDFFKLTP